MLLPEVYSTLRIRGESEFQLRVIVSSVLTAVESFNEQHHDAIAKIGFWSEDLCLPGINARDAGQIIKEEYEEHYKREAKVVGESIGLFYAGEIGATSKIQLCGEA